MFNTEFIIADIMQKHINTAKIVGGYVDFLTEKSIADILFAKNFCKLQKQRAAAHRRINGTALTPDKDGNYTPLTLKKGDRVYLADWSANEVKLDGKEYQMIREEDILGVLDI